MILDASVLVAFLSDSDSYHAAAAQVLSEGDHTIHAVNFGEVAAAVFRGRPSEAHELLNAAIASPDFEVAYDAVEREAGRLHAIRPSKKVSLADCFAAALAATRSEAVVAADNDFLWFAKSAGIEVRILAQGR